MVIDTSALVAMVGRKPEAAKFAAAIQGDARRLLSVVSLVEAGIVLERRYGSAGGRELEFVVRRLNIEVAPVTVEQRRAALLAYWRFGKGIHPAGLNFGDCFPYALARETREALLFKGGDFSLTDVERAV